MSTWLTIQEYSYKHSVSISTLRRKIKSQEIEYSFKNGRYFLKPPREKKTKVLEEIKKYQQNIEEQKMEIKKLKEEREDLVQLIEFLEKEKIELLKFLEQESQISFNV